MPRFTKSNKSKTRRVKWEAAPDIRNRMRRILAIVDIDWIKKENVYCFRSFNTKTKAYARIWGLPRIWQQALKTEPAYIIEVISERFDKLKRIEQDKVLLHEIAHIPKNFSGSLVPHFRKGRRNFKDKAKSLVAQYLQRENEVNNRREK